MERRRWKSLWAAALAMMLALALVPGAQAEQEKNAYRIEVANRGEANWHGTTFQPYGRTVERGGAVQFSMGSIIDHKVANGNYWVLDELAFNGQEIEIPEHYNAKIPSESPTQYVGGSRSITLEHGTEVTVTLVGSTPYQSVNYTFRFEIAFANVQEDIAITGRFRGVKDKELVPELDDAVAKLEQYLPEQSVWRGVADTVRCGGILLQSESDQTQLRFALQGTARAVPQVTVDGASLHVTHNSSDDYYYVNIPVPEQPVGRRLSIRTQETPAYTAVFAQAENMPAQELAAESGAFTLPQQKPVREGYRFEGWAFGGKTYQPGAAVEQAELAAHAENGTVTFTALWKAIPYKVTYAWAGEFTGLAPLPKERTCTVGQQVAVDDTYTAKTELEKAGYLYRFSGWRALAGDEELAVQNGRFAMPAGDVTLTGSWARKEAPDVTITYKAGEGGGVALNPAAKDAEPNVPAKTVAESVAPVTGEPQGAAAVAEEGYYFVSWTDADGEIVGQNAEFLPQRADGLNAAAEYTANFAPKKQITLTANSAVVLYDGKEQTVSGFETLEFPWENGESAEAQAEKPVCTVSEISAAAAGTDAGTYPTQVDTKNLKVTAPDGSDVTGQFEIQVVPGTLTILPRSVSLTSADAEKEYDGTSLANAQVDVSGDGFAEGEGADYTVTGAQTLPGSSENTFAYTLKEGTKTENYKVTTACGTLTVKERGEKYPLTLTAKSAALAYNGAEQEITGFETLEFTVNGQPFAVCGLQARAAGKAPGTYKTQITGAEQLQVRDAQGSDVTAQFTVAIQPGTLTIQPRTDLSCTVHFVDAAGVPLRENQILANQTQGERVKVAAPDVAGYTPRQKEQTLEISADAANELTFVYDKLLPSSAPAPTAPAAPGPAPTARDEHPEIAQAIKDGTWGKPDPTPTPKAPAAPSPKPTPTAPPRTAAPEAGGGSRATAAPAATAEPSPSPAPAPTPANTETAQPTAAPTPTQAPEGQGGFHLPVLLILLAAAVLLLVVCLVIFFR